MLFCICAILYNFYPRPPRGGRHGHVYPSLLRANFYPRPPRGGRRSRLPRARHLQAISIHALREEGDFALSVRCFQPSDFYPRPPRGGRPSPPASVYSPSANFYPRPPRGGRLSVLYRPSGRWRISIHALREEGDATFAAAVQDLEKFLSTPSARRATGGPQRPRGNSRISIHALREEGDRWTAAAAW